MIEALQKVMAAAPNIEESESETKDVVVSWEE